MAVDRQATCSEARRDGHAVFSLVSMLDYNALLECADRLRTEGAHETRL